MLFFFGELDSTRLIQGDTAAGDERITLLDVCAGRCTMPIPLAHSRSAQEERQMEFGRWAKQVWLGRRKGSVTLAASWQRATFSPPKCNVAMRLALASVGVTLIDGGSRGGGAVVRSVLKRNHRRYQRAMRPRRELLRASFQGTSFGGAWHSTGKIEVEFKLPWLQVETPLLGARRPIIVQPMLDEGEVEALDARGGDVASRAAKSGGASGGGAAAAGGANAGGGGAGDATQRASWAASASDGALPPALVDVLR